MKKNIRPTEQRERNRQSVSRGDYVGRMCRNWVRKHRPDIYKLAEEESFKKFPLSPENRKYITLPASMDVK